MYQYINTFTGQTTRLSKLVCACKERHLFFHCTIIFLKFGVRKVSKMLHFNLENNFLVSNLHILHGQKSNRLFSGIFSVNFFQCVCIHPRFFSIFFSCIIYFFEILCHIFPFFSYNLWNFPRFFFTFFQNFSSKQKVNTTDFDRSLVN